MFRQNGYIVPDGPACDVSVAEFDGGLRRFVDEIIPCLERDLQPFGLLYGLYLSWCGIERVTDLPLGRNKFIRGIADMAESGGIPGWYTKGRTVPVRPKRMLDGSEPLLSRYPVEARHMVVKATYMGLLRVGC